MTTTDVLDLVRAERIKQDRIHGSANRAISLHEFLGVLTEEVGEAAQALNDYRFTDKADWAPSARADADRAQLDQVQQELVQVAAVAVAMVERISRESKR